MYPGAQKCVGSAAHPNAIVGGGFQKRCTIAAIQGQRLFHVQVLARPHNIQAGLEMHCRDGEVQNNVNFRIGKQPGRAESFGDAPFFGRGSGPFGNQIGAGRQFEARVKHLFDVLKIDA